MSPARLTDAAIADAWASASTSSTFQRMPSLLSDLRVVPAEDAHKLPMGALASAVLRLMRLLTPAGLAATVACRQCGTQLEVPVPLESLLAVEAPNDHWVTSVEAHGRELVVRAPRPDDLAAASTAQDHAEARRVLLTRCLLTADAEDLATDDTVAAAVNAAWEDLDPLSVVTIEVTCPECGTQDAPLADILGWGWALVEARVRAMVGDVHRLASAYGWSEAEILALPIVRRRAYLELVP